ncbi:MAG: glycine/sarcosine/betaine reductase selenoprotein B family protein [Ktedonobacteraceae bacterium]
MKEDKDPRLTPANNRLREWAVRIVNDTAWGERLARWMGKVPGKWQLRWKVGTPTEIPWTPLKQPLAKAKVALITTGGVHLCSDKPFVLKSDATFRAIPRTATSAELCITHEHYDRRDAARDLNLIFPLQRLLELEAQGILGRVADTHYSFGFTDNPHELLLPGHEIGTMLAEANVDLVLLVPA